MNKKQQTIATYQTAAQRFAENFQNIGPRIADIEESFRLSGKENPKVLEIGCGSGRDAAEICKRTNNYTGIDVSSEFIKIAREKAPTGVFQVADVEEFAFPQGLDIVFAFASLIHVPKDSFRAIVDRIFSALKAGGVVRISLKHPEEFEGYEEVTRRDEFGERTYYLYPRADIEEMLRDFTIVKSEIVNLKGQDWLEVMAQKS